MVYCKKCGVKLEENSQFCHECGTKVTVVNDVKQNLKSSKLTDIAFKVAPEITTGYYFDKGENNPHKKEKWPTNLAISLGIWGIINLIIASPVFGAVLIFFAILIYASKSFMAIYAFGIVYLFMALIQLLIGTLYLNSTNTEDLNQAYTLIVLAFINFVLGGYVIYNTRKLDE